MTKGDETKTVAVYRRRPTAVPQTHGSSPEGSLRDPRPFVRLTGAGSLIATAAIHLDLYLTGYRTIPTIGWLFLLQVIIAFGLGAIIMVSTSRLLAAAGAGFAVSTLGGYLLSLRVGLFGFREVRTTAGIVAGITEITAFAILSAVALGKLRSNGKNRVPRIEDLADRLQAALPRARWVVGTCTIVAAVLLGVCLSVAGPTSTSAGSSRMTLRATKIKGVSVLTNARGYTLYWFAPDSPTKSKCYGDCAVYWPPVLGKAFAGSGVRGEIGTITRSGGAVQVIYDHHPLYTYVGDAAPGQATGNNVDLNGGLWYEMTVSG